jgi:hypothetical protein
MLTNSQSQTMTLARMGEVGKALGKSCPNWSHVWKLGSAGASAAGAINQIKGCLGDIVGQGTSLAKQIQAVAKLLQTAVKIIDIVKAANAAVAALMSNPWTHAARGHAGVGDRGRRPWPGSRWWRSRPCRWPTR